MIVADDDDDSSSLCGLEFHHQPIVRDENLLFLFPFVKYGSLFFSAVERWDPFFYGKDVNSRYSLFVMYNYIPMYSTYTT